MKTAYLILTTVSILLLSTVAQAQQQSGHDGMHHGMDVESGESQKIMPGNAHDSHRRSSIRNSKEPIPPVTDADRVAAFPDLDGMDLRTIMDTPLMYYALLDRFEWADADPEGAITWNGLGWIGTDRHRLWIRTEGEITEKATEDAELQLLYGRPFARWWDWVLGVRHDFKPGNSQTWLGGGVQGLAPYWFETELSLYRSDEGQTNLRLDFEYDLLITQRLVLQPALEINAFGKDDTQRGIGSGLSTTELGLRLRYEIIREIAPYIGINWTKSYGETADMARSSGGDDSDTSLVLGIRLWY